MSISAIWENLVSQLTALGGQRAVDTSVALIVFSIVMGIVWFLWWRRSKSQTSHIRSLETEQLRLTAELATLLQRYEIALRGSNVTVFTQDRDLRYTSISNDFLGYTVDEIIDRTDEDLIPIESRAAVTEMKRSVIETGQSKDRELQISDGQIERWYDFHVEPIRSGNNNRVDGLACAVVDITASKEGEEHLRLLMREISHRSKNLLAIIQAMARQTSRNAVSVDDFLNQFNARVQALARSHDLLVQQNWHGAGLRDLLRSQLSPYADSELSQVSIEGPAVLLKPETAQNLGLALHELAANASKYGALSVPSGRIDVHWTEVTDGKGKGVELVWAERGGPTVGVPERRGFGSMLIQQNLSRTLESEVDLKFEHDGVNCRIMIPQPHLYSIVHEQENGRS
jgi:PAS domain S-box-containing protein